MKKRRRILIAVLVVVAAFASLFFAYTADYYHADEKARTMFAEGSGIREEDNLIIMTPDHPDGRGFVFYPGGKVQAIAYIPLLEKLKGEGITCVLVKMPFNLAVLNANAANGVYDQVPGVQEWYIGGHSLGGAMASAYAQNNTDKVRGLILLGAYIYGDVDPGDALTVYGSEDRVMDRSKIDYTQNIVVVAGGNHAQFGNYGKQAGDGEAGISSDEQQAAAVQAILGFMQQKQ